MDIVTIVMYTMLFTTLYFEVFLLITFFEQTEEKEVHTDNATLPTAAVIVPCFNEETTVAGTLNSLLALDYPVDKLQIIAVNDGSTDNTWNVLRTFEDNERIQLITKENGGKHTAMNTALQHTNAEIIGCLDADSFVEPDALRLAARHFANPEVAAVTPSIKIYKARSVLEIVQKAEYSLSIFIRKTFAQLDSLFITPGPFSFYRHSVLKEIGSWRHAHSTEDLEICLRLQKNHKKVTNEPSAIVHTKAPKTLLTLYKQRVRWTYGFLKNIVDYYHMVLNPRYGTLGMFILPVSIISLFSALILFASLAWNVLLFVAQEVVRFQTVGITAAASQQVSNAYVSGSTLLMLTVAILTLTLVLISIGKTLAKDSPVSFDTPVYLALYGFLAPLWLTGATYKALTSRSIRWR